MSVDSAAPPRAEPSAATNGPMPPAAAPANVLAPAGTFAPATATFSHSYKIYVLCLLTLVYVSNYADRMILSVLIPSIMAEFQVSKTAMGFLAGTAFAIFYATLGVPLAVLADRWNRRNIIAISCAIWSGMTALCGVATSYWALALARVGVGIGEAGGSPPSHSIISDLFTAKARATALAVFALGVPFGLVLGLYGGALVAETYGWRGAFIALGIPGLVLALLVYFTIAEPQRGSAGERAGDAAPAFRTVVAFMLSQRALVHVIAGATLTTLVGYAGVVWWPTFIVQAHGLDQTKMSLFLALVFGLAGGLGTFFAGWIGDTLARRDARWMTWVVAVAIVIGLPFGIALYLVESTLAAFVLIAPAAFIGGFYLPPTYAITQGLVGVRMRAVASAMLLFVINLIGMGLGPLLAGTLSDLLERNPIRLHHSQRP